MATWTRRWPHQFLVVLLVAYDLWIFWVLGSWKWACAIPHRTHMKRCKVRVCYKVENVASLQLIPFSAFWLRSSVVSVLISLISDTWAIGSHDIKLIFLGGGLTTVACYWSPQASPMRCTTARAWHAPTKPISNFFDISPLWLGSISPISPFRRLLISGK